MKSFTASITLYLLLTGTLSAQQAQTKPAHAAATSAVSAAAKICDDPYQVREPADGWPEAPVYILFHREKSKAPWSRNPAIRIPGAEAASAAGARTLVCVEESRLEMGRYDSGEAGYTPSWDITLVRLADRKVYFHALGLLWEGASGHQVYSRRRRRRGSDQAVCRLAAPGREPESCAPEDAAPLERNARGLGLRILR